LKNRPTTIITEGVRLPITTYNRKPPYSLKGVSFNFHKPFYLTFAPYVYGSVTIHFGPLQERKPCCSKKWENKENDVRA